MKNHIVTLLFFLLTYCLITCTPVPKAANMMETALVTAFPDWSKNANIYEVNIRQYTPEGTIKAFHEQHLQRLKTMGVDILWLMPIFPISETKRKGNLGSYYAVSSFRRINPEFGTMADVDALIQKAHELGMKIILDWVPNHTGWNHEWITAHPDYYTHKNGQITDPLNPKTGESEGWTDVADLNYDNPAMREAMIADLLYWVKEKKVDGFRMDIAYGVPLDFWQQCIPALRKANPELFLLAEAELPEHQQSDSLFTMNYAWTLHHRLNAIAQGKDSLEALDRWYAEEKPKFPKGYLMHFITNHDENSWAGTEQERMKDAVDAMAVLAFTFDGMPLIYSGQEEPLTKRLQFFEKDLIEWKTYSKQDFYAKLLALKHRNQALWNGEKGGKITRVVTNNNKNIYAYYREQTGDRVLVILNLSNEAQTAILQASQCEGTYNNLFLGNSMTVTNGQTIHLKAWDYLVLELQK
ncbi:MAG: alpha-amylase [Saprospiraceae bacterium]|nr:alpha-amylase [Saprospiraceae bacterium]